LLLYCNRLCIDTGKVIDNSKVIFIFLRFLYNQKARHVCPNCDFSWASDIPSTIMNLRKVDFFWINRDQHSFEWFVNLLSQLEIEQAELGGAMERFLDMVSLCTHSA